MENNALYHHGVKGMRWGVRRYQNEDGSLTPAGKKRYGDSSNEGTESNKPEETYEERKQKAIKSGSAKEVLQFKGDLTQQEMQSVSSRIKWEQEMQGIADKELSSGKKRTEKIMNTIDETTGNAVTLAKAYNMAANVYNAFNGKGAVLPKVETNITGGNRSERQAWKKEKKKAEDAQKKREEQEAQRETKHAERAEKKAKQTSTSKSESDTVYSGTVEGTGTSSKKSTTTSRYRTDDAIDVAYKDVRDSSATSAGKDAVIKLLGSPKEDDR